jgi:hypothetical protein
MVVFASVASGCSWQQTRPLGIGDCKIEVHHRSREKQAIDKAEETSVEPGCSSSAVVVVAAAAAVAVDYSVVAGT